MRNADPETIRLIYRSTAVQAVNAGAAAAALNIALIAALQFNVTPLTITAFILAALSSFFLASNAAVRLFYRLNPFCPVCGLDAVDCKINRQSLSDHPQN